MHISVVEAVEQLLKAGEPVIKAGEPVIRAGEPVIVMAGEPLFRK